MKPIYPLFPLILLAACSPEAGKNFLNFPPPANQAESSASTQTLILFYDADFREAILNAVRERGATVIYDYAQFHGLAIRLPNGANMAEEMQRLRSLSGVLSVEPDRTAELH